MPRITPARGAIGCLGLVSLVGGFASGVYLGVADRRGLVMDSNNHAILKYAPTTLSGILTFAYSADISQDSEAVEEMVSQMPPGAPVEVQNQMRGCVSGCGPVISALGSAGITSLATYLGYCLGKSISQ